MQIHKSSAFRNHRHTGFIRLSYGFPHGRILFQLLGKEFRIAAIKDHTIQIFRKCCIPNRGKRNQFGSHLSEEFQIVLINKTKCLIQRHPDAYRLFRMKGKITVCFPWNLCSKSRCRLCQFQKLVHFQRLFQNPCQFLQFLPESLDFFRKDQTQMSAFYDTVLYFRHIAHHRQIQFFFNLFSDSWI